LDLNMSILFLQNRQTRRNFELKDIWVKVLELVDLI